MKKYFTLVILMLVSFSAFSQNNPRIEQNQIKEILETQSFTLRGCGDVAIYHLGG